MTEWVLGDLEDHRYQVALQDLGVHDVHDVLGLHWLQWALGSLDDLRNQESLSLPWNHGC